MLSFEDIIYHFTVEYEKRLHDYKKIAPYIQCYVII